MSYNPGLKGLFLIAAIPSWLLAFMAGALVSMDRTTGPILSFCMLASPFVFFGYKAITYKKNAPSYPPGAYNPWTWFLFSTVVPLMLSVLVWWSEVYEKPLLHALIPCGVVFAFVVRKALAYDKKLKNPHVGEPQS